MTPATTVAWWRPAVGIEERDAVARVIDSNYVNEGGVTTEFEDRIAELVGARFAVAATSGTSALFLALAAAGIGRGDEVIVPDVTFIASANAVTLAGATPVLVDVDPATLTIDPTAFRRGMTARTKAVMPVHVSGRAARMRPLLDVAESAGIAVIEDAAEALGSKHENRCLGTFGAAGCFSFSPNKMVTTGQGGIVVTDDEAMAVRMRELKDQGRPVRGTGGNDVHDTLGYNFKLTNLQAAVGLAQLAKLPARMKQLQDLYRAYVAGLTSVDQIQLLPFDVDRGESPQWVDAIAADRDALVAYLLRQGIECRPFWYPIHAQRPYRRSDVDFPVSTRLMADALWLPSALTLGPREVAQVCDEIKRFYGGAR